jgi:cytochrome P450
VQRRLHEELDGVLAGRAPTADDLAQLTYATMVVKEAMRLYPPAYAFGRRSAAGDRVGGRLIPPGAIVVVSPWATHRRPELWPDPERFDPERFAPEAAATRHRYAWLPFGGGPRVCIGNHFALAEAVVATAVLLAGHRLRADPGPVPLSTAVTLRYAGPVRCEVAPRRPAAPAATALGAYPASGGPA